MSGTDYTTTPNLGLFKPNYDMDDGQWGTHLNSNADVLDGLFGPGGNAPFLPLTGGTVSGPLTIASMRAGGATGTNTIWLGPWTETSTTGPYAGDFVIQKFYNVAGGPVGNVSSIVVQSIINNAPNIYVSPIMSQMYSNTTGPSAGVHAGISSAVYRQAGPQSLFAFWGPIIDSSGLVQGTTVGGELDIQANGPEASATGYNPAVGSRMFLTLAPSMYPAPAWLANHAYTVNTAIQPATPNGFVYVCTVAGTSGASPPTWPTSAGTVTDGSVTWQFGTTKAVQISRGISFGTDSAGPSNVQYGAGIYADGAYFYDAICDFATGHLVDGGVKDAAIRLASNMPIDFSGDGTDAGQNVRTLRYKSASGALEYQISGSAVFAVADNANLIVTALPGQSASLSMNRAAGHATQILGQTNGANRWMLRLGNDTAEGSPGSNIGSDLDLYSFSDAGNPLDIPLTISRATGVVNFAHPITIGGSALPPPCLLHHQTTPAMNGSAAVGTGTTFARADHVHGSDTSRLAVTGGTLSAGVSFSGAAANNVDLTQHINLSAGTYGFNVQGGNLNYNVSGAGSHAFYVAGGFHMYLNSGGTHFLTGAGFWNTAPLGSKPTLTGAWAGNTAGKALATLLASYGLLTDSSTA